MTVHYSDELVTVHHGDCIEVMATLPDNSVDSIVTDPPYGLEFMGKDWDSPWKRGDDINADAGMSDTGYSDGGDRLPRPSFTGSTNPKCLDCGGTRRGRRDGTAKVLVCLCDTGGRFPNVRAAEMRAFGEWCELWTVEALRVLKPGGHMVSFGGTRTWHRLAVAVEDAGFEIRDSIAWLYGSGFPKSLNLAGEWEGWGTALKPAFEPIVVGRKPLAGTVAANVLAHGTGALNIAGNRVGDGSESRNRTDEASQDKRYTSDGGTNIAALPGVRGGGPDGRWPTNVLLDESQAEVLDAQSGTLTSGRMAAGTARAERDPIVYGKIGGPATTRDTPGDAGGASRFFPTFRYEAKAPTSERPSVDGVQHPTVKPLELMRWLVRLVTPAGGLVLEPFAGSGTTIEAALAEGFRCIGIEREAAYLPLIDARIHKPIEQSLFGDWDGAA